MSKFSGDDVGQLFTTNGKDAWRCVMYAHEPTIRFENLDNGDARFGTVGSLNVDAFKRLVVKE